MGYLAMSHLLRPVLALCAVCYVLCKVSVVCVVYIVFCTPIVPELGDIGGQIHPICQQILSQL